MLVLCILQWVNYTSRKRKYLGKPKPKTTDLLFFFPFFFFLVCSMKTFPFSLWLVLQPSKFWKNSFLLLFSRDHFWNDPFKAQARCTVRDMTLFFPAHLLSHQVLVVLKGGGNSAAAWDRFQGICHGQMELSAPDSPGYLPAALWHALD